MKRLILVVGLILVVSVGALGFLWFRTDVFAKNEDPVTSILAPDPVEDVISRVLEARVRQIESGGQADFGDKDVINVLLLGLDARKENNHPHCDAIHMFSLNVKDWTMSVHTIPRGTYVYIPPGNFEPNQYYISNACSLAGLDYSIGEMEKILGIKKDFLVTVNFSQALGILRALDLPTTTSLQWLRHRQSYAIGEPQRSHNQAVFMKDVILSHSDTFRNPLTLPAQYVLYSMVDTDMDFATARTLLHGYIEAGIDSRPDDITLAMKPSYPVVDYHLDIDNADAQVQALVDYLKPYLSPDDLSLKTIDQIQTEFTAYLNKRLASNDSVADIFDRELWLQVEIKEVREDIHYRLLEKYINEVLQTDPVTAQNTVSDYVLQMKAMGEEAWAEKGKELLASIVQ